MRVLASAIAVLCSISSAFADPSSYGRVISFGDSLSDNGNLTALGVAPPPPYYYGRFSNGPTWVEILAGAGGPGGQSSQQQFWVDAAHSIPLNGTSVNVALGGARADNGFNSNGPIPGVPTQIASYEFYSTVSGQTPFKSTDLVTLLAGANDIFQGFGAAAAGPNPVTALSVLGANTAGYVDADLKSLIAGGAKTVLISNLPNLGATPSFNGKDSNFTTLPGQAAGGALVTAAFNSTLNSLTQQTAAQNTGVNIIQMDLNGALNVILANPSAFGFTNSTLACIYQVTCNGSNFLFWDGVHPTKPAHILIARYAALLLSTEETGQAVRALGQAGLSNRLDASDIIFRRGATPGAPKPDGAYAEIIGSTASFNGASTATYGSTSYDYSLGGVRVGFDGNSGPVSFGSSFAYQSGSLSGHALSATLDTAQIDAYALRRFAPFFAGVEGGASFSDYNKIHRATGFPTVTADGSTMGLDYSGDATIGAQYQFGGITLTPAARVGYTSINIDSFTESAPILALQYGNQTIDTGFWTARLRASSSLFGAPNAIFWAEAGYEGLFATSDSYQAKLAFNTAHAVTISDSVEARGFFLKTGVGGYVYNGIKLSGEYELSLQNGAGDIQSGRLRVTIPLNE